MKLPGKKEEVEKWQCETEIRLNSYRFIEAMKQKIVIYKGICYNYNKKISILKTPV